nr:MAG TPA: hypothetical protein [Caudoviricetes sp.]
MPSKVGRGRCGVSWQLGVFFGCLVFLFSTKYRCIELFFLILLSDWVFVIVWGCSK